MNLTYYDTIVAGGGIAGISAAWAAATGGAHALLLETNPFLGGTATAGGVSMYINWKAEINGQLTDISGNFYRKLMQRLNQCNARYPKSNNLAFNCDFVDIEAVKFEAERLLLEAGVKILYHTRVSNVMLRNNNIAGIAVSGKNINREISCKTLIDCTGDADCCRLAGAQIQTGREKDNRRQPVTMIFTVSNVNHEKLLENPAYFRDELGHLWLGGAFRNELKKAALDQFFGEQFSPTSISMLWSQPLIPSNITFNVTKIYDDNPLDAEVLTYCEIECRKQTAKIVDFLRRYVYGFEKCTLATTYHCGIRESYRLSGQYTIDEKHVLQGIITDDSIALCAHVMDSHLEDNHNLIDWNNKLAYGIPYRAMLPKNIGGLLVAGRCLSGTHLAAGSYRAIGTASTTGEAAGIAAAMAKQQKISVDAIDKNKISASCIGRFKITKSKNCGQPPAGNIPCW